MAREFFWYCFQPTYRPPNKMFLLAIPADLPHCIAVCQMMEHVNPMLLHRFLHNCIAPPLPQIVIGSHPTKPLLPPSRPLWQVIVEPVYATIFWMHLYPWLDILPVALTGQYPEFKVLRHLEHPVPPHTYLASEVRLTCVGGDKYLHVVFRKSRRGSFGHIAQACHHSSPYNNLFS